MKKFVTLLFSCFVMINKVFPLQPRKILFIVSHDVNRRENIGFIAREVEKTLPGYRCVFLTRADYTFEHGEPKPWSIIARVLKLFFVHSHHIATAKTVIVENFFFPSAYFTFKKQVKVIQIWHSSIAFKKFGLDSVTDEGIAELIRKITKQYTHVIVNSEKIKTVFADAFGVSKEKVHVTGNPRTDFYYDPDLIEQAKMRCHDVYRDMIRDRKVLLYAPTFREEELQAGHKRIGIELNIDKLHKELHDEYVFMIKLHPRVMDQIEIDDKYRDFVIDVSGYPDMNDLLAGSDVLITDYSSIILEYALLKKPIIFYPYDLEKYNGERGFYYDYKEFVPGPIVYNTDQLIRLLRLNEFDLDRIRRFAQEHQDFRDGKSSHRFVELVIQQ